MTERSLCESAVELDPALVAWYLEVPRPQIVLLQAYFELYDGVGTVRTLEGQDEVVTVLTTPSQKGDCIGVLNAIREQVSWRICATLPDDPLRGAP